MKTSKPLLSLLLSLAFLAACNEKVNLAEDEETSISGLSSGQSLCVDAPQNSTASLNCGTGKIISSIDFASFGNATGKCGNYSLGTCHSSTSTSVVNTACLNKTSCGVAATSGTFGNVCSNKKMRLKVQYRCAINPTSTSGGTSSGGTTTGGTSTGGSSSSGGSSSGGGVSSSGGSYGGSAGGTVSSGGAAGGGTSSGGGTTGIQTARYYVAPDGNDSNPGTFEAPFATLEKLNIMVAGDTAYIRGGTYRSVVPTEREIKVYWKNLIGTAAKPIQIFNYPGERPVLDYTNDVYSTPEVYGLYLQYSEYVHIKGLRVTGLAQHPSGNALMGMVVDRSNNNIIENMEFDHLGGTGFMLLHSNNNLVLNSDSHHMGDGYSPGYNWGGTNGFAITNSINTSTHNTFRGCRVWWSSDNGFAFFGSGGTVTVENSWVFWIGYIPGTFNTGGDGVGFKLGPGNGTTTATTRILRNNLAFENRFQGFDENFNSDNQFVSQIDNNTSYNNGTAIAPQINGYNFNFQQSNRVNIIRNNLGYISVTNAIINPQSTQVKNSWNGGVTVTNADFLSLSSVGMDGPRKADGSLPDTNFLKLAPGSDLINAGANIGLPYNGTAPDIGAFESN